MPGCDECVMHNIVLLFVMGVCINAVVALLGVVRDVPWLKRVAV
jgi:hypothetical protein